MMSVNAVVKSFSLTATIKMLVFVVLNVEIYIYISYHVFLKKTIENISTFR